MGAREPRASALRPRPPPEAPSREEGGGRGHSRRPQIPVEPRDSARGRGWGRPKNVPAAGSGAFGGRRPGQQSGPRGRSSAAVAKQAAAAGAQPRDPARRPAATAARGRGVPAWGRPAGAREWAPTGTRAALPRHRRAARALSSPPGSRGSALAPRAPGPRPVDRNCSAIDSAAPGGCGCGARRERVRKAGGQEVRLLQRGWRDRTGTEPSLFMSLPALACFLRRLEGESASCRPRV